MRPRLQSGNAQEMVVLNHFGQVSAELHPISEGNRRLFTRAFTNSLAKYRAVIQTINV
jgi:hypothetical protein